MILPIIMAGGTGSRLWPLSRELYPKQFLTVTGEQSMLQQTVARLSGIEHTAPVLICNEEHRFIAAEQMRLGGYKHGGIILEPVGRNTAPAIALAALQAVNNASDGEDPVLLVLAADHVIENTQAFTTSVEKALPFAEDGQLVTFGIVPTAPETGYGYIRAGEQVESRKIQVESGKIQVESRKIQVESRKIQVESGKVEGGSSEAQGTSDGFVVAEFVEKPDLATAQGYLESGEFYWNSGMFMFKASRYLEELQKFAPEMLDVCKRAIAAPAQDLDFVRVDKAIFETCPDDSIDYAVMEKTDAAMVVPMDAGWSDVGSWSALWDVSAKDENNNVSKGDVIAVNSVNSYLHAENKLIATVGIDNLIVVETKDAILVADKDQVQDVKSVVNELKNAGRSEHKMHREVYRLGVNMTRLIPVRAIMSNVLPLNRVRNCPFKNITIGLNIGLLYRERQV